MIYVSFTITRTKIPILKTQGKNEKLIKECPYPPSKKKKSMKHKLRKGRKGGRRGQVIIKKQVKINNSPVDHYFKC